MLKKVIISGGGTGGHIFPAIAIANEIKKRYSNADILFVGALGKMEMEKIPQSGYSIIGLPIAGFKRNFSLSNLLLPFKILKSLFLAIKIIKNFKPEIVIGVGGYASGPTLKAAILLKIPTLIQEQNSYAGKTNKMLSKNVNSICTAYPKMEIFFPKNKILLTGNPIRTEMVDIKDKRDEAIKYFNLDDKMKTIFIMGGSLGAKTLNDSVLNSINLLRENNIQVLWQSGKYYYNSLSENIDLKNNKNIYIHEFINKMDYAYSVADLIISRSGALSVSELCIVGKACIFVPSPNVAEDHQTKNAKALVDNNAAILIKDSEARELLFKTAIDVLYNEELIINLSQNIKKLALPNANEEIVNQLEKIIAEK